MSSTQAAAAAAAPAPGDAVVSYLMGGWDRESGEDERSSSCFSDCSKCVENIGH